MQGNEAWRTDLNERLIRLITSNQRRMENDETTPPCLLCDAPRVGILTPCYLMLRGNYVFSPEHGAQIFIFDDELKVEFTQTMGGRKACFVDVLPGELASVIVHDDCAETIYRKKEVLAGFEMYPGDDEDVEDLHREHHERLNNG